MGLMLTRFIALMLVHFLGDFILQTHWQATNKSKSNVALLQHVTTYTVALMLGSALIFPEFATNTLPGGAIVWGCFILTNALLHFITDYVTSRHVTRFFARKDTHNGFVVIGLDQWIHQATLAATMWIFFHAHL